MVKDPVCGAEVDENSEYNSTSHGKTWYFDSAKCKEEFDSDPHKYVPGHEH